MPKRVISPRGEPTPRVSTPRKNPGNAGDPGLFDRPPSCRCGPVPSFVPWGVSTVEAHGGYLCRFEDVDVTWLQRVACSALEEDGQTTDDVGLQVTLLGGPGLVRFAWDAPFTYGRKGARWYLSHHALARRLSEHLKTALHVYVFDPDELEQVMAYGNGRRVGGELVRYVDFDFDCEDEAAFERVKDKWPIGHLARVLGVPREELLRFPRQATALIDLQRAYAPQPLWRLFPESLKGRSGQRAIAS